MSEPSWITYGRALIGTREIKGPNNDPTIMRWATDLKVAYPNDETAWCGLFVGHVISKMLPKEPLPAGLLGSRNWASFGVPSRPVVGSVLVFWRGTPTGWQGHVGFYVGEDATAYHVLGGNQGDSVSIARVSKDRLIKARMPLTARTVGTTNVIEGSGKLSTNEA